MKLNESAPLIFWLLVGYFQKNDKAFMKTEGIFRITSRVLDIRVLNLHLSKGSYATLANESDPHVVTNYWKHLLREMKEPLIPFSQYEKYGKLEQEPDDKVRITKIKELLQELRDGDLLRYVTLKFLIDFFREVVELEGHNRMTAYNIAVTVGPNIFRPAMTKAGDIVRVGIFYNAMLHMIQHYGYMFDEDTSKDKVLSQKALGSVGVYKNLEVEQLIFKDHASDDDSVNSDTIFDQIGRADESFDVRQNGFSDKNKNAISRKKSKNYLNKNEM